VPPALLHEKDSATEWVTQITRLIAWGQGIQDGITAARAAARLAEAVDLIEARQVGIDKREPGIDERKQLNDRANKFVDVLVNPEKYLADPFKKNFERPTKDELKRLANVVSAVQLSTEKGLDDLRDKLPKLQVQWVAQLGKDWQRFHWD